MKLFFWGSLSLFVLSFWSTMFMCLFTLTCGELREMKSGKGFSRIDIADLFVSFLSSKATLQLCILSWWQFLTPACFGLSPAWTQLPPEPFLCPNSLLPVSGPSLWPILSLDLCYPLDLDFLHYRFWMIYFLLLTGLLLYRDMYFLEDKSDIKKNS